MELGLAGKKTAPVLGGGLGRAISRALARERARGAVGVLDAGAAAQNVKELEGSGARGLAVPWDLADPAAIEPALRRIEERFGPVDVLVDNTGGPPPTPASGQDRALWTKSFQAMVLSVIAITRLDAPAARTSTRTWSRSSRASARPSSPARSSAWTAG